MVEEVHDGFRLLVDSIKDCAMYLIGADGTVMSWNPGSQAMFGYAVEQIKVFTIVAGDWAPGGEELTPTMKLKRRPIERRYAEQIESMYEERVR